MRELRAAFFDEIYRAAGRLEEQRAGDQKVDWTKATGLSHALLDTLADAFRSDVTPEQLDRAKALLRTLSGTHEGAYVTANRYFEQYMRARTVVPAKRAEATAATIKLKKFASKKQSIPTPFGEFDVAPRLALLGLAFAAVSTFLLIESSARRVVNTALRTPAGAAIERAPHWFFVPVSAKAAVEAFGWNEDQRKQQMKSSLLFYGSYLLLSWLLAVECIRWRAFNHSRLLFPDVTAGALVILNLVAFVQWLLHYRDQQHDAPMVAYRRSALAISVLAPVAVIAWIRRRTLASFWRTTPTADRHPAGPHAVGQLIVSNRGVVHSFTQCIGHLPKRSKRTRQSSKHYLHPGYEVRILYAEALALERNSSPPSFFESAGNDQAARYRVTVELLESAIAIQPNAYHLYDALIRVHRAAKKYDAARGALMRHAARAEEQLRLHPRSVALQQRVQTVAARLREDAERQERAEKKERAVVTRGSLLPLGGQ